jgi:hypothetical protein
LQCLGHGSLGSQMLRTRSSWRSGGASIYEATT